MQLSKVWSQTNLCNNKAPIAKCSASNIKHLEGRVRISFKITQCRYNNENSWYTYLKWMGDTFLMTNLRKYIFDFQFIFAHYYLEHWWFLYCTSKDWFYIVILGNLISLLTSSLYMSALRHNHDFNHSPGCTVLLENNLVSSCVVKNTALHCTLEQRWTYHSFMCYWDMSQFCLHISN